ncbi:MAG: cation diffusion facilitator family transporter [Longimicrobiales bacterium]
MFLRNRQERDERAGAGCSIGSGPSCQLPPRTVRTEEEDAHARAHAHVGQSHVHGHAHAHDHHRGVGVRGLRIVLALTAAFAIAEFVGGLVANSLALIADAGHMLTDVGAIALSLFSLWFARRPATDARTFGYLRLEILAALVNGATLIVISVFIFVEAWSRFATPAPVDAPLMLAVATGGLLVNIVAAVLLHRSAGHSLNVRGAYLHVIGDLLGSLGAIGAALVIMATGWTVADPFISVLVGILILVSSWKLVRESVDVLLESVPGHIDLTEVRRALDEIPGVDDIHDLHVWTLTSGFLAMSGHAVVRDQDHQPALDEIYHRMRERFGIRHVTFQLEREAMYLRERS